MTPSGKRRDPEKLKKLKKIFESKDLDGLESMIDETLNKGLSGLRNKLISSLTKNAQPDTTQRPEPINFDTTQLIDSENPTSGSQESFKDTTPTTHETENPQDTSKRTQTHYYTTKVPVDDHLVNTDQSVIHQKSEEGTSAMTGNHAPSKTEPQQTETPPKVPVLDPTSKINTPEKDPTPHPPKEPTTLPNLQSEDLDEKFKKRQEKLQNILKKNQGDLT